MYDTLCAEQYRNMDAPGLLEVMRRYQKAMHVAGELRFPYDKVVSTAAYGDPKAAKRKGQQSEVDRKKKAEQERVERAAKVRATDPSRITGGAADIMLAEDAEAFMAAPNEAYQRQLDKGQNHGGCSNCGNAEHYWGWCPLPYNESKCSTARAAQRSAPRDSGHFKYLTKRIKQQKKPNPLSLPRKLGN
jgi:hypothetical protein